MKLLFILGNGSVGKMTVGQELAKITEMRLFYNHMTIEPVYEIFGQVKNNWHVVGRLREVIFEEFAKSDCYGMIFTYMLAFNNQSDWDYINYVRGIFKNAEIYIAELIAPQEVRLARNSTENRLKHKPSKRDLEFSRKRIIEDDQINRYESYENEVAEGFGISREQYIRVENAHIPPEEAARMIKERFNL